MKIWKHFDGFYRSYGRFKFFTFAHAQTKVQYHFEEIQLISTWDHLCPDPHLPSKFDHFYGSNGCYGPIAFSFLKLEYLTTFLAIQTSYLPFGYRICHSNFELQGPTKSLVELVNRIW